MDLPRPKSWGVQPYQRAVHFGPGAIIPWTHQPGVAGVLEAFGDAAITLGWTWPDPQPGGRRWLDRWAREHDVRPEPLELRGLRNIIEASGHPKFVWQDDFSGGLERRPHGLG